MALPTPPTSPLTWSKVTSTNPSVGPDLYYTAGVSSVQTTRFYSVPGGKVLPVPSGVAPDGPTITWTLLAGTATGFDAPALAYAPIEASGSHGLYLLTDGRLAYD